MKLINNKLSMTKSEWLKLGQTAGFTQNDNPDAPNFTAVLEKPINLPQKAKGPINKELTSLGNYHQQIPLDVIFNILKKYGVIALQEDYTKWGGFLVGGAECGSNEARSQVALFDLASNIDGKYMVVDNNLMLSWCKMPSGKYEIVTYIS